MICTPDKDLQRGLGPLAQAAYLVPLAAHEQHAQHVEHLHLVHYLMDDLHGLGQVVPKRAGGEGALV